MNRDEAIRILVRASEHLIDDALVSNHQLIDSTTIDAIGLIQVLILDDTWICKRGHVNNDTATVCKQCLKAKES